MILTVTGNINPLKIEFDYPFIGYKAITLKSVTLYNSFYNVYKIKDLDPNLIIDDERDQQRWHNIILEEGFYTCDNMIKAIYDKLKEKKARYLDKLKIYISKETNQLVVNNNAPFTFRLLNKHPLWVEDAWVWPTDGEQKRGTNFYCYPFNNYCIHCNILDTHDNYFNGKPSDVLETLPVIETVEFASKHTYDSDFMHKKVISEFREMELKITDEDNNLIDFHRYPFLFKLELL